MINPADFSEIGQASKLDSRGDLKKIYFSFLTDFKKYLVEYVKETSFDLCVSQFEVTCEPAKLWEENQEGRQIVLKNQGEIACYLTTDRRGGYRLDPGEKEKFWLNAETLILTLSGTTTVGYIRT